MQSDRKGNNHQEQCASRRGGNKHNKWRRRKDKHEPPVPPSPTDPETHRKDQTSGNRKERSKRTNTNPSSSQATSNAADESSIDIPGFYYDKEKKRYFKILPNQHKSQAGAVTKDVLKQKKQEEVRQKDIQLLSGKQKETAIECIGKTLLRKQHTVQSRNIYSKLESLQQGWISQVQFKWDVAKQFQTNLQPLCRSKVFESPMGTYERLEHMHHIYASQLYQNQLICLWSLKDLLVQRIQTLSINSINNNESETQLGISVTGAMIPKAFSKITDMCCAPVNSGAEGNEYILYTTMCVIGNNPSMAFLRNLHCSNASDFRYTEFNLGSMATWCCAWNPSYLQFSIGTEKHGILLDVETRRLWQMNTGKGDVLCQAFSNDSKLLYSGTKKGDIYAHDLRSISTSAAMQRHNGMGVCSLRVSADDRYVYTSDFNSKIKKWDMRQRKVQLHYAGHHNDYSVLPIHVNEEDNLLYAAGQDSYTRLWDLTSGRLLTSIPPPYPASMDCVPALHYTSAMTHRGARPGLFMGIKDELHFYSL